MTEHKNFTGQATPSIVDTEYRRCNFTQETAHTRLFPGDDTPRTFTRCNLKNCDLPPGSATVGCMHGHASRDPANDEYVNIDNEPILIEEAYTWEKVV